MAIYWHVLENICEVLPVFKFIILCIIIYCSKYGIIILLCKGHAQGSLNCKVLTVIATVKWLCMHEYVIGKYGKDPDYNICQGPI